MRVRKGPTKAKIESQRRAGAAASAAIRRWRPDPDFVALHLGGLCNGVELMLDARTSSVPYCRDGVGEGVLRYRKLLESGGDCEDWAGHVLAAARRVGVPVESFVGPGWLPAHAASFLAGLPIDGRGAVNELAKYRVWQGVPVIE